MPGTALLLRVPLLPHVLSVPVDGGERAVELSSGFAGADEVEGGGAGRGPENKSAASVEGMRGAALGERGQGRGGNRLIHPQELVALYVFQCLDFPAGPANVNLLHYGLRSQAKMHALVAGRKITARRGDSCELTALARDQAHFGANRVAVALMSYKMQRQPVVRARRPVVEHVCLPVIGGDHSIELAVVIDIADGKLDAVITTNDGQAY